MKIYKMPNDAILDTRAFIGSQEGQFAYFVDPEDKDRFFPVPCEMCENSYLKGYTEVSCRDGDYVETYPSFLYGLERHDWKNWSFDPVEKKADKLFAELESGDRSEFARQSDAIRKSAEYVETMKIPSECLHERVIHWDENVPRESLEKRYEIRVAIGGLEHRLPVAKEALGYSRSHKTYYLDIKKGLKREAVIDVEEGRALAPVRIDDVKFMLDLERNKSYDDGKE